ncbi:esterase-like activity of phytase family protein [Devosia sp. J2-20]|uniref:esterase-like activity of phytase family protein n=1 Tax=Devosia sp. J2-20 TaxID=3026161 RepID=UPI00249AF495|nr:esterase-like activity of phytase family protein [Devosia sp. J2-20]WDQ99066.1 esterase-like activity of phytase family protein [Devosia sp. J2-20]
MSRSKMLVGLTAMLLATTANAGAAETFNRIASFDVAQNAPDAAVTSSEIIAATDDGMMLIYSDSPAGGIGFVDITDAKAPKPAGFMALDGEPTSVTIVGNKAYVGVNTSESYTMPSGKLVVVDIASQSVEAEYDLGGQPDSVAHNAAGTLIAVAIENERDEDLGDGGLPQMPAGFVVMFDIAAKTVTKVEVTGLAEIGGEDPEPEFVDFNDNDEIVLTMQENNAIVIIDGQTGAVTVHFSAGTVSLDRIDTKADGAYAFTGSATDLPREPDAVQWLDNDRFVIANEGDWNGGSRGFSILNRAGEVLFDSGADLEHYAARVGHYPDKRAGKKGVEPEGLEVGRFGENTYIFVTEERSSLIAVYRDTGAAPEFVQVLPSGISPEGLVAIPQRNLLATANEVDLREEGGVGSHVMVYELAEGVAQYPQLIADLDAEGLPIGWSAISGAVADAEKPGMLYAVSDSFVSAAPAIYAIDATAMPARITGKTLVTRGGETAQKLDLEGIALDGEGGFWLASEGRTDRLIPHALYHVDADGEIEEEVAFPAELLAQEIRFGAEGITSTGRGDDMTLWIAMQREWQDDAPGMVKLVSYKPASGEWGAVHYPLETPADGTWNGLSEIVAHGEFVYIVERDNQIGAKAQLKALYRVSLAEMVAAPLGGELPVVSKELVRDFVPDLMAGNGYVLDKVESFAIDAAGNGFVITDNDGVDDSSGETMFWSIGAL